MKITHIYPGTFCLPHYGHKKVVEKILETASQVTVICSDNKEKNDRWFNSEECKKAWEYYNLNEQVKVVTLAEFIKTYDPKETVIVMVRGIRTEKDLEFEKKVLKQNQRDYGIKRYLYIVADENYRDISSTKARNLAMEGNLAELEKIVHPKVAAMLVKKAQEIRSQGND